MPKLYIEDTEELRNFIKTNKEKEDYFDRVIEKVMSKEMK